MSFQNGFDGPDLMTHREGGVTPTNDPRAREYFAVEIVRSRDRGPIGNWIVAVGYALMHGATLGLLPGAPKSILRIRSVQTGEPCYESEHRIEDGVGAAELDWFVSKIEQDLGSMTPREFAAAYGIAWPPNYVWHA
jgi:hypothetical protein